MWPTEARATPDEKNTIRFPVLLAKPRQQAPVRPGLLFLCPKQMTRFFIPLLRKWIRILKKQLSRFANKEMK